MCDSRIQNASRNSGAGLQKLTQMHISLPVPGEVHKACSGCTFQASWSLQEICFVCQRHEWCDWRSELASSCHSSAHWIGLQRMGGFCCGSCCYEPFDPLRGWFACQVGEEEGGRSFLAWPCFWSLSPENLTGPSLSFLFLFLEWIQLLFFPLIFRSPLSSIVCFWFPSDFHVWSSHTRHTTPASLGGPDWPF